MAAWQFDHIFLPRLTKKWLVFLLGVMTFLAIGVFLLVSSNRTSQSTNQYLDAVVDGHTFKFEPASTESRRKKGLSGREVLKTGYGMLFIFHTPDSACFWMKDMRFNIDILWFDANKKLIYQQQNLSPDTYPQSYCPPKQAQYVVELGAGESMRLRIKDNSSLSF